MYLSDPRVQAVTVGASRVTLDVLPSRHRVFSGIGARGFRRDPARRTCPILTVFLESTSDLGCASVPE